MYRKHFALTAFPFDLAPQPEELFASATLTEAEARLQHLLELRAIGLVTGEAGSGKTTQLPKLCLEAGRGLRGLIAQTLESIPACAGREQLQELVLAQSEAFLPKSLRQQAA